MFLELFSHLEDRFEQSIHSLLDILSIIVQVTYLGNPKPTPSLPQCLDRSRMVYRAFSHGFTCSLFIAPSLCWRQDRDSFSHLTEEETEAWRWTSQLNSFINLTLRDREGLEAMRFLTFREIVCGSQERPSWWSWEGYEFLKQGGWFIGGRYKADMQRPPRG